VTDYSNNTTTITYDNLGRALTQSCRLRISTIPSITGG